MGEEREAVQGVDWRTEGWWRVESPYAVGAVRTNAHGVIVECAPIFRRKFYGGFLKQMIRYGFKVEPIRSPESVFEPKEPDELG